VPSPTGSVVKNGSSTRSRCSGGMPLPVSLTWISYSPSTSPVITLIRPWPAMASIELDTRFITA